MKVIHGRVHQTETDFESPPASSRPKSDGSEGGTRAPSAEDGTEDGNGPTATYVATTEKPSIEGQDEDVTSIGPREGVHDDADTPPGIK